MPDVMTKTKLVFSSQLDLNEKISAWAHELRSPFNQVIGFTKIILNEQSGPLTDLQKDDLTTIYHNSLRALMFVNSLIEIARLQKGEKVVSTSNVDIRPYLDNCIDRWHKNNPEKGIPIALILSTNIPSSKLDQQKLQWVLNAFFSYMAAYSDGTGHLTLEVAEERQALIFTLQLINITKRGVDEISKEMFSFIGKAYIDLMGGEIRQGTADDSEVAIQFVIPRGT